MKKFCLTALVLALFFFTACSGKSDKKEEVPDGDDADQSEITDGDDVSDTDVPDGGDTVPDEGDTVHDGSDTVPDDDADTEPDSDPDNEPTEPTEPTDEPVIDVEDAQETVTCRDLPALSSGVCEVTSGNAAKLVKGNILSGNIAYIGGEVLIGADGFIVCAGCDCSEKAAGATVINCPGATVTPALINGHDHLGYVNNKPGEWGDERFDHRHDWRKGQEGHHKITVPGSATVVQKQWAELRQLMAGTLSITGSGGAKGFLRNIDQNFVDTYGLEGMDVKYQTFPLGDSDGTTKESGCDYSKIDSASVLQADCYLPHVSEGINKAARNEFLCLTGRQEGGIDLAKENSAFVHSVGIIASDGEELAKSKTAVIWSPRTNISLYGNTAPVTMLKNQGVLIGLGTDWVASGSMHMLRELACVDYLNNNHFAKSFSDYEIWKMATVNNAAALRILDVTGSIRPGLVGDIVVFDAKDAENPYRAVISGHEKKVALVLRGGQVFYGDADVVTALDTANECEALSVCDVSKKVCVKETGMSLSEFQSQNSSQYKLFYCTTPDNEPTCVPQRTRSEDESRPYSGPKEGDKDGDGVADEDDNCPDIFNPIRPVDNGKQADSDNDGVGDACDPCPMDKESDICDVVNASDKDGDGIINAFDNCPFDYNPDQEDANFNGTGDACETFVAETTIYEIKQKNVAEGSYVKVSGIVTAYNSSKNFYMQVATADQDSTLKEKFSGIYVYKSPVAVNAGDKVSVTGTLQFYKDSGNSEIIEISSVKKVEIISSNNALPAFVTVDPAVVKDGGELKDAYNGVLVKVENVDVTEAADSYHVFGVANGLKVDDDFYSFTDPAVGTHFVLISGVLTDTFGHSKILPRSADDFVINNCLNSTCDSTWSQCEPATGNCLPKEGFCASKAECPNAGEVCDTENHLCVAGNPCEGVVCEYPDYQECSEATGTCVAKDGMCVVDSDCAASEECNTATHECVAAPIIRNGGFEKWTDSKPDSWYGSKTNIASLSQETAEANVHGGSSSVKLVPGQSKTRFSTAAYTLPAGTYNCEYYAKGTTQTGLAVYYPGQGGNGDFSSVSYKTVEENSWTQITYSFTLGSDVSDFQLVVYAKNADNTYVIVDDLSCTKE